MKFEPRKEVILIKEGNTQVEDDVMRVRDKRVHASGPNTKAQHQFPILGPTGPLLTLGKTPEAELGLIQPGLNFILVHVSPKQQKLQTTKKPKRGDQKKNNENGGSIGKEKASGWKRTQP